jgi:hypothetical protein
MRGRLAFTATTGAASPTLATATANSDFARIGGRFAIANRRCSRVGGAAGAFFAAAAKTEKDPSI